MSPYNQSFGTLDVGLGTVQPHASWQCMMSMHPSTGPAPQCALYVAGQLWLRTPEQDSISLLVCGSPFHQQPLLHIRPNSGLRRVLPDYLPERRRPVCGECCSVESVAACIGRICTLNLFQDPWAVQLTWQPTSLLRIKLTGLTQALLTPFTPCCPLLAAGALQC